MIFVDTGMFLGLYHKRDQHHADAHRIWRAVKAPRITSNHVIDEVATGLARLAGYLESAGQVEHLYASQAVDIVSSTREDELEAIRWMRKYAGQYVSFTDCVSFALMRRCGVDKALTFDRHFRDAGFEVVGLP